jgi:glycosyltransferase involved in cell wall biosynthesis
MKISVIIGTYNQKDKLKLVLESFNQQSIPFSDYEVIVVDSSSSDGTEAMVEALHLRYSLNYICQKNQGKSAARNRGVNEAKAEIILLTDADMVAHDQLLENHLQCHLNGKNIAVEGVTLNLKKEIPIRQLSPDNPEVEPYIKQKLKNGQRLKWSYFLSGNLSLRKKTFLREGGFDVNFSQYGWEDIELGYRLNKMGVPLIYNTKAFNYHYHFVTDSDMLQRKYNMGNSAAYFHKKHPKFEVKMFLGINPLAMLIFNLLHKFPSLLKRIKNQYILEEYYYRLGLTEELEKLKS